MKKIAYLLVFVIVLTFFHGVSFAEPAAKLYKHTAVDLGIAKRHDIGECRINRIVGDEVFFWTVKENARYEFEKIEFYLVDIADDYTETKIPFALDNTFVTDVYYSGQYIYILYHNYSDEQCILQIDKEGTKIADFKLKGIEKGQTVYNIFSKDDGRIIATGRMGAAGFDAEGNMVWQVERKSGFGNSAFDGVNRLYCDDVNAKYEIDTEEGKLLYIQTGADQFYAEVCASCGNGYLCDSEGIKLIDGDWDHIKPLINYFDYGIEGYMYAFYGDTDKVRFIDYDYDDKNTKVLLHTIDFTKEGEGKKEILLLFPEYMPFPGEMYDIIYDFNRFSEDYYVRYSSYAGNEELGAFYADVHPDVVLMPDVCIRKHADLVTDLMPYMKKAESLTPDSLLPAVKRNYTDEGSFLMIPLELSLNTYVVKQADYDRDGFATRDYFNYISRDGALYTDYFLSKESVMKAVMETRLSEFVNYGQKTGSFNSSAFKSLVSKIDGLSSDNYYYAEAELAPAGEDDRILDDARISSLDFFAKKRAAYGEAVTAVGKPSKNGATFVMSSTLCMAIAGDSPCPEGAFEFIEYFSTHYTGFNREGTILANKKNFEESIEEYKKQGVMYDSFGKPVVISVKDIDFIVTAIDNSVAPKTKDAAVMDYVTYYTDAYFNGEMTLKEATDKLQETVSDFLKR